MQKLKKIYGAICKAEEIIAGIFLVTIMITVFSAGVGRSIGHPLNWAMDLSTFLFAWVVFLSGDAAMRRDMHVNVKFLVRKLPEKVQYYLALLNYFIIVVFLGYLIRYGISQTYNARFRTFQGIPGFSYAWATLSVPVGSLLILISTILKIRKIIKTRQVEKFKMEKAEKVEALSD